MRKIKLIIPIVLLFMVIGFATITTSLSLNADMELLGDLDNFAIYYSRAIVNGSVDYSIIVSPTELDFGAALKEVGTPYVIEYDITNASSSFDAQIEMTCIGSTEYFEVSNVFDNSIPLEARQTRTGTLTLKKIKTLAGDAINSTVSCSVVASPVERNTESSGVVPVPLEKPLNYLKASKYGDSTGFRASTYKTKIKNITFEEVINVSESAIETWDLSAADDGSIVAYVVANKNDSAYYDLYIQSNSQIYANPIMSHWFAGLEAVDSIKGLDLLDFSKVIEMKQMFNGTGKNSSVFALDLGNNFDTSNVTNMSYMFKSAGYSSAVFTLDLGNKFDTSKVTDMSSMFYETGYSSDVFTLDLGDKFDTGKVTNMSYMFYDAGKNSAVFTLDLGNKFDTSNVTNMWSMFSGAGKNSTVFTLDLGDKFDTGKVTNMRSMFYQTGYSNTSFTLDISNFDTSNVTDMTSMFRDVGYNNPNFTLDVSNLDTSKVTNMSYMFYQTGHNSTKFTLDLGDKFDTSNVTNMSSMFYLTGWKNTNFTLDLGDKFDTSNVTNMSSMFNQTGYSSTKLNFSITIRNPNVSDYSSMFKYVATMTGSKITVNYTTETESLVAQMIATKSATSNVVLGYNVDNVA